MGSVDCDWLGQVQWRFVFVYYESNNMWGVLTDWLCQVQWPWWRVLTVLTDCTVTPMGCVDWLYSDPDGECWLFWLTVQWPRWGVLTDWLCQVQWSWWRVLTVLTDSTMTLMGNVDCFDWLWPGTMTLIGKADCLTDYDGESWVWALTVARCDKTLMRSVDCLTDCGQVQWSAGGEHEAGSEEESGYRSGHWLHHVLHVWFLWAGLLVSLFPASAVFTLHMAQEDEADESEISFISWCGKKYVRVR